MLQRGQRSLTVVAQAHTEVTGGVPGFLMHESIPGYKPSYVTGTFGYFLIQSAVTDGIGIYHVVGETRSGMTCLADLSSTALAVLILLEGAVDISAGAAPSSLFRQSGIGCLFSPEQKLTVTQTAARSSRAVLLLYPVETIISVLSFHPLLSDLQTSLRKKKGTILAESPVDVAVMDQVYHLIHTPFTPSMEAFCRKTAIAIAHLVCSGVAKERQPIPFSLPDLTGIRKAKEYIDEHLSIHLSIRQIAKKAGINQFKLKKGFKEMYGAGLYGYLLQQRLIAAKMALELTQLPLKEISTGAGYKSVSNFCTAFRRQFGATPGQIRKGKGKP